MRIYIKNMVCLRCEIIVKQELSRLGMNDVMVNLGFADIRQGINPQQREMLGAALLESGLELMYDRRIILIERIKNIITEIVHYSDEKSKINFSDYLSSRLNYDYTYMANLFSAREGTTIERFMILHKIERVKELLLYNELSVGEIATKMHYSSISHLANQFKKTTGLTTSHFKSQNRKRLVYLEDL